MYVSNTEDNVLSLLLAGNTTTVAGSLEGIGEVGDGGPATAATLSQPSGTAEDAAGYIYLADTEDNVIRKIHMQTGIVTRIAGTGVAGDHSRGGWAIRSELDALEAVAVNAAGDVFVADTVNNRVVEVLRNGRFVAFAAMARLATRATGGGPLTRS